jgi:hypothetical protein
MRIALCLSGQPRGLPLSCEKLKEGLIIPNGITDIFMHTWYHPDYDGKFFDSAQPHQSNRVGYWKEKTDEILKEQLAPITLLCERPNDFLDHDFPGPSTAVQTKIASLLYGIWKANELKKDYENLNGFKYDIVIRTRIDMLYDEPVILANLIREAQSLKDYIYAPAMYQDIRTNDEYFTVDGTKYSSMTDIFLFGSSENMDKMSSGFPEMKELHQTLYPYVYGESYVGYLTRCKHNIKIATADIKCQILHRVVNLNNI